MAKVITHAWASWSFGMFTELQTELRKDIAMGQRIEGSQKIASLAQTKIRICLSQLWDEDRGCT
ncbi:hypothetical protein CCR75_008891 [Bremia lactucae]|uniref:Uncharacterized protein n=1 Tax=Bremia lactucae TaxID=4779 RepID=A0A976FKG0_BRELC|nr:hypothetical protein CCR75_008891 [Bremia lactucae]